MDTTTVLEIIKMIDKLEDDWSEETNPSTEIELARHLGGQDALGILKDHLQSFIEGQVNAAENQSTEQ